MINHLDFQAFFLRVIRSLPCTVRAVRPFPPQATRGATSTPGRGPTSARTAAQHTPTPTAAAASAHFSRGPRGQGPHTRGRSYYTKRLPRRRGSRRLVEALHAQLSPTAHHVSPTNSVSQLPTLASISAGPHEPPAPAPCPCHISQPAVPAPAAAAPAHAAAPGHHQLGGARQGHAHPLAGWLR